ncbi:tRNA epoxyqueuosine(34) reductase QueG [Marinicella sp. W31]|uniref:tRNA epoxyqueuosine(34) reductase QueG n=1 Tax=Marinicella sp. W31 TaxID=3023713 RepID=UPI00375839B1
MKTAVDQDKLAKQIKAWGQALGFQQVGISDTDLEEAGAHLNSWLDNQFHGDMEYMNKHGSKRYRPEELEPGTYRIISVRMDYSSGDITPYEDLLQQPDKAAISRYALGRDYHKVIRKRLQQLAHKIEQQVGEFGYRVFTDSAPVMEKAIAEKAGLGWIGKHSNVLNAKAGSWFFLGEIYTDLALPVDEKASFHCGSCRKCLDACPTQAIVAPFKVDARRCISYLTIENHGAIPVEFRKAMGNRIYGCDDCQMVCPWNKFATPTLEADFSPRHHLDDIELLTLFRWDEETFLAKTAGSPIRRIGYQAWQRNIAVALGNSDGSEDIVQALKDKLVNTSDLVREHVEWALENLGAHT